MPSEDERVKKYFLQFKPHYKTFEPKKRDFAIREI